MWQVQQKKTQFNHPEFKKKKKLNFANRDFQKKNSIRPKVLDSVVPRYQRNTLGVTFDTDLEFGGKFYPPASCSGHPATLCRRGACVDSLTHAAPLWGHHIVLTRSKFCVDFENDLHFRISPRFRLRSPGNPLSSGGNFEDVIEITYLTSIRAQILRRSRKWPSFSDISARFRSGVPEIHDLPAETLNLK